MIVTFGISVKLASPSFLKIKVFWNKGYEVIISAHNIISKILSRDPNYIVDDGHMNKFWKL